MGERMACLPGRVQAPASPPSHTDQSVWNRSLATCGRRWTPDRRGRRAGRRPGRLRRPLPSSARPGSVGAGVPVFGDGVAGYRGRAQELVIAGVVVDEPLEPGEAVLG